MALKLSSRAASPTGTFTVTLRNSTTATDAQSVTVNVSDLHVSGLGWIVIKFGASHTPNGTDSYIIRCVCSNTGSQVTLYRSTTGTNNICKKIRQTTTQAPASGNHIVICNELTGAGTSNALTVTMDNTATTSFGPTVSSGPPQGMVVSGGGTLTFGTTAATNYYLKLKGVLLVTGGGTINVGTSGTRMPSTSTAVLEFDCVASVDSGLRVLAGGTFNAYGATKTTYWTTMTADKAASATVIALVDTTGWAASDEVCFAPSSGTVSHFEKKTISTVDSATQITLTAGLTNAHQSTSPALCEVGNLTRNIKLRSVSSTNKAYIFVTGSTAVLNMECVQMKDLGSATSNRRGIDGQASAQITIKYSSGENITIFMRHSTGAVPILNLDTNVVYNSPDSFLSIDQVAAGGWGTIRGNLFVGMTAGFTNAIVLRTDGLTDVFRDNTVTGNSGSFGTLIYVGPQSSSVDFAPVRANWQGNTFHHCVTNMTRIALSRSVKGTLLNWKIWSSGAEGMYFDFVTFDNFTLEGGYIFGVTNGGLNFNNISSGSLNLYDCVFASCSVGTAGSQRGLYFSGGAQTNLRIHAQNTTFGVATGVLTAHSTADIGVSVTQTVLQFYGRKVTLASTTKVSGLSNCTDDSFVSINNYGGTEGDHRGSFKYGTTTRDTNIVDTALQSLRCYPSSTTEKFKPSIRVYPCNDGAALTVSVRVRKSSSGDATYQGVSAANYNGNQPRLIVKRNSAVGVTADTVLDTMTAAVGTWESLSGTTATPDSDGVLEFYVECDGTAGSINIENWTVS